VTEQRLAVIVGVDGPDDSAGAGSSGTADDLPRLHHAEDDARAVRDALCDSHTGTFDRDDVRLFVGPDATTERVKSALMEIVSGSSPSDVLVVYFAGHSLIPAWSRATDTYLVTSEFDQSSLARNPDAGLRMTFLKRDILEAFPGKALLILDCCHAGTLLTAPGRDIEMISVGAREKRRYTALMASAANDVAREDPSLRHGVLTYHALQAMRGGAVDANGDVTFESLASYVTSQDIHPEPGVFTQTWGRGTVLTRPGLPKTGSDVAPPPVDYITITPLENPLDRLVPAFRQLIDRVSRGARDSRRRIEYLKSAMDADAAAVIEYSTRGFKVIDSTARFDAEYVHDLLRAGNASLGRPGHLAEDEQRSLLSVPVERNEGKTVLLAVLNPSTELLGMGEPLAKILQAVWHTDLAASPEEAEIHVLTGLREAFGRLPEPLYERYRQLQRKVLESLTIVFQPIITIGKIARHVGVHSYEALARRSPTDLSAPLALLQTAHAWGDRLIAERDEIIVAKTLSAYADAHADRGCPWDVPKPVSVNVAVRSLLSDSYVQSLQQALEATGLNPEGVMLEIAEHDPIKPRRNEQWSDEPHAFFHKRLVEIGRDLNISFAVDDFGSDYASLSRMAELPLTQIKVDRPVLHHSTALEELEFVERIARHSRDRGEANASRVVIVEGVDDESPVTLRQIYNVPIRHVQGYITQDPAAPTLRQLRDDVREDIAARVRGDDEKRQTGLARGDRAGRPHTLRRSA
jgi:EAL domain-containing protein (putative c-di-GMP-specific phosphodiesterase class I)